jgi:hypothetical protein
MNVERELSLAASTFFEVARLTVVSRGFCTLAGALKLAAAKRISSSVVVSEFEGSYFTV